MKICLENRGLLHRDSMYNCHLDIYRERGFKVMQSDENGIKLDVKANKFIKINCLIREHCS